MDRPGALVEIAEREDGVLELRPQFAVPATESRFWDASWRSGELEVDSHVIAGEVSRFDGADDFLASLDDA